MTDPIRPTDDDARQLARALMDGADHAALAVIDPATSAPMLSRVSFACDHSGAPVTLVSTLSAHSKALAQNPACSLMVAEAAEKGDPLTHARLTLQTYAQAIPRDHSDFPALRDTYLAQRPKSKLYIDFADFYLIRFQVSAAFLNGGFGQAFHLTPADLGL